MIYATVGTMHLDFGRLVRALDGIGEATGERIVVQTGMGRTIPTHCEHFDFRPREAIEPLLAEARVVITHAGIGSAIDALRHEKPLLVAPRLRKYGEHNNDHQLDLARAIERRGWGRLVLDMAELAGHCAAPPPAHTEYRPARAPLIAAVRGSLGELIAGRG